MPKLNITTEADLLQWAKDWQVEIGIEKWSQEAACAAIATIARDAFDLPNENAKAFAGVLRLSGFGGNASQFRQRLERKDDAKVAKIASNYGL